MRFYISVGEYSDILIPLNFYKWAMPSYFFNLITGLTLHCHSHWLTVWLHCVIDNAELFVRANISAKLPTYTQQTFACNKKPICFTHRYIIYEDVQSTVNSYPPSTSLHSCWKKIIRFSVKLALELNKNAVILAKSCFGKITYFLFIVLLYFYGSFL